MSDSVNSRLSTKANEAAEKASFKLAHATYIITVVSVILYIGSIILFVL